MVDLSARLRKAAGQPKQTVRSVITQVREDDVPFMAGSIAYQAFISLFPLLVLLFIIVAAVGDETVAQQVVALTEGVLPEAAQSLLSDTIRDNGVGGTASIIGAITLVWGSLKIFRGLDTAFSEIYETSESNSIVDQLRDGLVVFTVLAVSLVAMVAVGSFFAIFEGLLARVVNLVALVVGLTIAFLPMYRYFPDADLPWAEAVPGALFAAIGWTLLQSLFQFYVALSGGGDATSIVGAVILLLTWLYLGGLVLLLGAVVNAVLLGKGKPEPQTDESDDEEDAAKFHRERDRRQTLEHEVARLERRLAEAEATSTHRTVDDLQAQNRQLRRHLRWLERPFPVRVALRALGRDPEFGEPPDPPPVEESFHSSPTVSDGDGGHSRDSSGQRERRGEMHQTD